MEIIEIHDDHVIVPAYDLPSGTVDEHDLYDSELDAQVCFIEIECSGQSTGKIEVTRVYIDNKEISTTFVDRNLMAEHIKDRFAEIKADKELSKAGL